MIEMLNKNILYVPMSMINDKSLDITEQEKQISNEFYNSGE